ncbi:MAG: hypothetical protein AB1551_08080 [Actinomycetota bacterium]
MDDLRVARARRWWHTKRKISSAERAAAFVEDVGFALLFPNKGVSLPTLLEVATDQPIEDLGWDWGPDAERLWAWKDEMPRRGLAWYARFLRGRPSFLSPGLLADLHPRSGRSDDFEDAKLSGNALRIARMLFRSGPQSTAALREALGIEGRKAGEAFNRCLTELGRQLVITHYGVEDQGVGWPTPVLELTARAFAIPKRRDPHASRLRATRRFLDTMLVVRPFELGNAFGWGADAARAALEELAEAHQAHRDGPSYILPSFSGGR